MSKVFYEGVGERWSLAECQQSCMDVPLLAGGCGGIELRLIKHKYWYCKVLGSTTTRTIRAPTETVDCYVYKKGG